MKTEDNPANHPVPRGCTPDELIEPELWWCGYRNPVNFGRNLDLSSLLTWRRGRYQLITWRHLSTIPARNNALLEEENEDMLKRLSAFTQALRVINYCFRFINRVRKRHSHICKHKVHQLMAELAAERSNFSLPFTWFCGSL